MLVVDMNDASPMCTVRVPTRLSFVAKPMCLSHVGVVSPLSLYTIFLRPFSSRKSFSLFLFTSSVSCQLHLILLAINCSDA